MKVVAKNLEEWGVMIDLHCHILPNLDDGAKTVQEAIQMAKAAVDEGITKIVATPHDKNGQYENSKTTILESVSNFNRQLQDINLPLEILPGQEIRLHGELLEDYKNSKLLTINDGGKYVLIEFSSNHVPTYAEQLLFDIQLNGLLPVIVHPERNQQIVESPEILFQFIKNGALSQVTASSVAGNFGKKLQRFSLQLIEHHMAHIIASDAHNLTGRAFRMKEAFRVIDNEFGEDVSYLFMENAELVVSGMHVYKQAPERIKKKKFLGLF